MVCFQAFLWELRSARTGIINNALIFLIVTLGFTGGVSLILFLMWRREQTQSHAEFREALKRAVHERPVPQLDFPSLVSEWEVSDQIAHQAALEIYATFFQQALGDEQISPSERKHLDALARAMQITRSQQEQHELSLKLLQYRQALDSSLRAGAANIDDIKLLESKLELSPEQVLEINIVVAQPWFHQYLKTMLDQGPLGQREQNILSNLVQIMGTSLEQALYDARSISLDHYRRRFTFYRQDGIFDPEEVAALNHVQQFCRLSNSDVASYHAEIQQQQRLHAIRNGQLPKQGTSRMLDGDELCHWDSTCQLKVTRSRTHQGKTILVPETISGQLTVTSKRILFTSPTKSFEFRPEKIVDLDLYPQTVTVQTSGPQGTGEYWVHRADELEAVLTGLANLRKFKTVEQFSSTRSRHIPRNVKQAVWARDGECCVQCQSTENLEYDHIIPFSKGGANTTNNIQLLCLTCNRKKSNNI